MTPGGWGPSDSPTLPSSQATGSRPHARRFHRHPDFRTFESTQAKNVHVIGDAIQVSPLMPKSAHMANQHAKVCAAAVVDSLAGREPEAKPMLTNTCYSFVSDKDVIHVTSVHAYDAEKKTLLVVPGSGGVSPAANALEGEYAMNWARNIWADTLM